MRNVLDLLNEKGIHPQRRINTKNGQAYVSHCPGCGCNSRGERFSDRFHVWLGQNDGNGSYWCRQCGKAGDSIQFLIDFFGMDFEQACTALDCDPMWRPSTDRREPSKRMTTIFDPVKYGNPIDLWISKAEKFVTWAHEKLMGNKEALEWLSKRGIKMETVVKHRLGWNPGENGKDIFRQRSAWGLETVLKENGKPKMLWLPIGLVIPNLKNGVVNRIRIRRREGEPRYYVVPGSSMAQMIIGGGLDGCVVVESELDAILISQEAGEFCTAIGLGSAQIKPDIDADAIIRKAKSALISLDFDEAGAVSKRFYDETYPNTIRWPVPEGKDPGDAYSLGIDIREWLKAGFPPIVTVGLSLLKESEKRGRKIENKEEKTVENEKKEGEKPENRPEKLQKIYELLAGTPVKFRANEGRITMIEDPKWARLNWVKSCEISQAVFMEPEVIAYLKGHPDEVVGRGNFWGGCL